MIKTKKTLNDKFLQKNKKVKNKKKKKKLKKKEK